jgi:hypothetical protein
MCSFDVRFTVKCIFYVIFCAENLKMTSKTHSTVKTHIKTTHPKRKCNRPLNESSGCHHHYYLVYPQHVVPELFKILDVSVANLANDEAALSSSSGPGHRGCAAQGTLRGLSRSHPTRASRPLLLERRRGRGGVTGAASRQGSD